jgi:hypothetical protein
MWWRSWSARAKSFLKLAEQLRDGGLGREKDWRIAEHRWGPPFFDDVVPRPSIPDKCVCKGWRPPPTEEDALYKLQNLVNGWLWLGNVMPVINMANDGPSVGVHTQGVFGALAIQVMLAVTGIGGIAFCSYCGGWFRVHRQPKYTNRRFCGECDRKAATRLASRDYRKRKGVLKRAGATE